MIESTILNASKTIELFEDRCAYLRATLQTLAESTDPYEQSILKEWVLRSLQYIEANTENYRKAKIIAGLPPEQITTILNAIKELTNAAHL